MLRAGLDRNALHPICRADNNLAWLDVAHQLRANDIECTGLRGQHWMTIEIAEHQRADAIWVAEADHVRLVHHDRREGSGDL